MKMQDVRAMAKQMGINSFGKTKVELVREVQRKEGNIDCYRTDRQHCDQLLCCFRPSCMGDVPEAGK